MADQTLLKGIRLFKKKDSQPEFVLATGVITLNELFTFAKENAALQTEYQGNKQIKIQILRSKEGNPYIAVDTWKPAEATATAAPHTASAVAPEVDDGLPF